MKAGDKVIVYKNTDQWMEAIIQEVLPNKNYKLKIKRCSRGANELNYSPGEIHDFSREYITPVWVVKGNE